MSGFIVPKTIAIDCSHYKAKIPKISSVRIEGRQVIASLECGHERVLFTIPKRRTHCYRCKGDLVRDVKYYQGSKTIPLATEKLQ